MLVHNDTNYAYKDVPKHIVNVQNEYFSLNMNREIK